MCVCVCMWLYVCVCAAGTHSPCQMRESATLSPTAREPPSSYQGLHVWLPLATVTANYRIYMYAYFWLAGETDIIKARAALTFSLFFTAFLSSTAASSTCCTDSLTEPLLCAPLLTWASLSRKNPWIKKRSRARCHVTTCGCSQEKGERYVLSVLSHILHTIQPRGGCWRQGHQ